MPGEPAPSPRGEELRALWLGGGGIAGAGAIAAGCAQPAEAVPGHPDVWFARGLCGSELRSLGVAAAGYLPALLYQQAAELAEGKAHEGKLLGASSRRAIRSGDFYVVDTVDGSFVLVRRQAAVGAASSGGGSLPCERFPTGNVSYTVVPPGLVEIWLEIATGGWVWPAPADPVDPLGDDFVFHADDLAAHPVAHAHCSSEIDCTAVYEGATLSTPESRFASADSIAAAAAR